MAPRRVSFVLVFYKLSEKVTFVDFEQENKVFDFWVGIPSQKSETINHLKTPNMASMETKIVSRSSFLDKLSEKLYWNGMWEG